MIEIKQNGYNRNRLGLAIEKIFLNQEHYNKGQKANAQIFKLKECAIAPID
jgi:hypothetical protein